MESITLAHCLFIEITRNRSIFFASLVDTIHQKRARLKSLKNWVLTLRKEK